MMKVSKLYPQYKPVLDRRQNVIPVSVERRSGKDRRSSDRIALDSRLTRDIFEVKGKISKFESVVPKLLENNLFTKNQTFAEKNNFTQDTFIKSVKPDITEITRQEAKTNEKSDKGFKMGVIAATLASAAAMSFMGIAGAVIAVGSSVYSGAKMIKSAIEKELSDSKKPNKM